jgi:hypothetical protein
MVKRRKTSGEGNRHLCLGWKGQKKECVTAFSKRKIRGERKGHCCLV